MQSSNGKHLILVLGMHRSGTSAMTRIISEFGDVTLPPDLLGPAYSNRWGHWEPRRSLTLNDAFLAESSSATFDPGFEVQLGGIVSAERAESFQRGIAGFLTDLFSNSESVIVKDPRISIVADHWLRAAEGLGIRTSAIFMFRHPAQVAASLYDRDRLSREYGKALWLKYNLICERASRGTRRVFVEFDALQDDWRATLARVNDTLALNFSLDERKTSFIEGFLDREARRTTPPPFGEAITERWSQSVYEWLRIAATGAPMDFGTMDQCLLDLADADTMYRSSYRDYFARFEPKVDVGRLEDELAKQREQMALYEDVLLGRSDAAEKFQRILKSVNSSGSIADPSISKSFNAVRYVTRHRDLFDGEVEPYRHYAEHGIKEGRHWMPAPDLLRASESLRSAQDALLRYEAILRDELPAAERFSRIRAHIDASRNRMSEVPPDFNPVRYVLRYADLFNAEVDPFEHYIVHGATEGRSWDFSAVA